MKKYYIALGDENMYIEADDVRIAGELVFFIRNGNNVAMFKEWNYFLLVSEENEVKPT